MWAKLMMPNRSGAAHCPPPNVTGCPVRAESSAASEISNALTASSTLTSGAAVIAHAVEEVADLRLERADRQRAFRHRGRRAAARPVAANRRGGLIVEQDHAAVARDLHLRDERRARRHGPHDFDVRERAAGETATRSCCDRGSSPAPVRCRPARGAKTRVISPKLQRSQSNSWQPTSRMTPPDWSRSPIQFW